MSAAPSDHPLAQLRSAAGVTQETLAATSGVSRSTIAAIEGGGTSPSRRTVRRLAHVFGLEPEVLASVLTSAVSVESVAHLMRWNAAATPRDELPVLVDDSAIRSATSLSRAITAASRRNRATLDELDIVRGWFNSLGPVDPIADVLRAHDSEDVRRLFDLLFNEARTDPTLSGSTALLSILLQLISRLAWSDDPLDPPLTFVVRDR